MPGLGRDGIPTYGGPVLRVGGHLRLSTVAIVAVVLVYGAAAPAQGQPGALSDAATANVQLVLDNMEQRGTRTHERAAAAAATGQLAQRAANRLAGQLPHIRNNLSNKLRNNQIWSVPRLDSDRYRLRHPEGDVVETGSPRAAYCVDGAEVEINGTWVPCPSGTIIVDERLLDPRGSTPLDTGDPQSREDRRGEWRARRGDWMAKQELLDILAHEKMHEILIQEQIRILEARSEWRTAGEDERRRLRWDATMRGATREMHHEVFDGQIAVVQQELDALQQELNTLREELRQLRRTRGAQERRPRTRELQTLMSDLEERIRWLRERIRHLIRASRLLQ